MRRVRLGGSMTPRERLAAGDPKFHAGPNPLQQESQIRVIQPRDADQIRAMTRVLEETYGAGTPEEKQALALWKFQVDAEMTKDNVNIEFLRGFYFWLLGRGEQADHEKTFWGRANAAVYNGEVAAYIDQFADKRTQYALQLDALSRRLPRTLNGYYLYYKYIVRGHLKRVKDGPNEYWDMSQEDYLQDFDLFRQEFEHGEGMFGGGHHSGYADMIAPAATRPANRAAFDGPSPYPMTEQNLGHSRTPQGRSEAANAYSAVKRHDALVKRIHDTQMQEYHRTQGPKGKEEAAEADEGLVEAEPEEQDLEGSNVHSDAPPIVPEADTGLMSEEEETRWSTLNLAQKHAEMDAALQAWHDELTALESAIDATKSMNAPDASTEVQLAESVEREILLEEGEKELRAAAEAEELEKGAGVSPIKHKPEKAVSFVEPTPEQKEKKKKKK